MNTDNQSKKKRREQEPKEEMPTAEAVADVVAELETTPPAAATPPMTSILPIPRMPTLPQLAVALGILVIIFGLSYLPIGEKHKKEAERARKEIIQDAGRGVSTGAFENAEITAGAAYVWDIKNQKALYNKNAGTQLPLASLTKLMTVLVAYEALDPKEEIEITTQALLEEGDSRLATGQIFTLRQLANLTLITSSNDGAYALAAAAGARLDEQDATRAFIDAMNAKAEEIGLSQSYFTNPTGLDVSGAVSGSYGSARDMAFLMEYLVRKHPEILEGTKEATSAVRNQEGLVFNVINTNEVSGEIPGLLGSKTGFTRLAGGNLVIVYDAGLNRPIAIAILGSTRAGRFSDVMTLIEKTAEALENE